MPWLRKKYGSAGVVPHAGDVDRNDSTKATISNFLAVVPHAGDVDRNSQAIIDASIRRVVPHAGDVDRNTMIEALNPTALKVVPHAGDVDRNSARLGGRKRATGRPPRGGRG